MFALTQIVLIGDVSIDQVPEVVGNYHASCINFKATLCVRNGRTL